MIWTTYRSRGETLREAVATAEARGDGRLPMDLPYVAEQFRDELDLLAAMMLRWHARLSGNLEQALAHPGEHAVVDAWVTTARQLPGLRAIIDHYADQPVDAAMAHALERATRKEWMRLAIAAGLAGGETPEAARTGRRLLSTARAHLDAIPPTTTTTTTTTTRRTTPDRADALPQSALADEPTPRPGEGRSLADRIRAALAA